MSDRPSACFVDTNVWLYAFIAADDPAKSGIARELLQTTEPLVSIQVVNEVCVNLLKRAVFTEDELRDLITAFFYKYSVVQFTESTLLKASELREGYSLSFWDSLIVSSALAGGVSVLYSEDMQHGLSVEGRMEIINPFQPSQSS
jgi:predicted nucleic acid-binding protein